MIDTVVSWDAARARANMYGARFGAIERDGVRKANLVLLGGPESQVSRRDHLCDRMPYNADAGDDPLRRMTTFICMRRNHIV